MKPIQVSGWYHKYGDATHNHYFKSKTSVSLCGKLDTTNPLTGLHPAYNDVERHCSICQSLYQQVKTGFKPEPEEATNHQPYYTPTVCPDCNIPCVIISSNPQLQIKPHIHVGCTKA